MSEVSVHDFQREVDCIHDDEKYSVRDNGAVLRHPRIGKRPRPTDNYWTFGKPNSQNGYMHIGSVRIHRIVATAFHGVPLTPEHVVDHIDTNRKNNRPENLRWLTRLENAILNPITARRIELCCGSIEAFLDDPSKLRQNKCYPNFEWMRTVSPEEAQACRERMHLWAKGGKTIAGDGSLGDWVFKPIDTPHSHAKTSRETMPLVQTTKISRERPVKPIFFPEPLSEIDDVVMAKTPGAAQRSWQTPTEFPCCPQKIEGDPIAIYAAKLTEGAIFAHNNFSTAKVLETAVIDDEQSVLVMCVKTESEGLKPWSLAKVTYEHGLFIHESMGTFFGRDGVEKVFCLARRLEWTGGDTFDDYCS